MSDKLWDWIKMLFEKYLRKKAYNLLLIRDNHQGVMLHKRDFLRVSFDNNIDIIKEHSFQKLKKILSHAFKTSPYYRELWNEIGFKPKNINYFKAIESLPFLTKNIIEKNKEKMISQKFNINDLKISYTGGSSGTPTSFYQDRNCISVRMGRQWGILEQCGYSPGDRRGLIWGVHHDLFDTDAKASIKRSFRKFASGDETLCCTVMNSQKMMEFHARLRRFRPNVLYGYPNAMAQFAAFIEEKKLPPIRVKSIICTAERLTEEQRKLLSEAFEGEVFNLYCTREHGCIGFECRNHNGFHIDIGSVHLEIISDGQPAEPATSGEIVITDLLNYGMPFIRNKIGDRGSLATRPCDCHCDLPLLSKLDGRVTDILYRPNGSTVAGIMLIDVFLDVPAIENVQIVQESVNEVDLFLVVTDGYNEEIGKRAIVEMREYIGDDININLKLVPEIPRNPVSGKIQEVICKIN
jgi:phenylacetate-CoA ligase